jgi:release factor glutamine methyltransferase
VISLVQVLTRTETWFRTKGVPSPRLDAELLLCHVLDMERVGLYLAHDRPLDEVELATLRPLVRRRGDREPLAWIVGSQGFHQIDLAVGAGVLVPRPDTETLVEAALGWIEDADPVYVADVGCGSGAVGLALAHARQGVRVFAIDIADAALETTRTNVAALQLQDRVAVLRGDLLDPIPENRIIDWVVSNPPYIPTSDIDALMPEVSQFEPRLALDGGGDGLQVIRRLITQARARARKGLLLEVGAGQAPLVADLLGIGGFTDVVTFNDLPGIERVVGGRIVP